MALHALILDLLVGLELRAGELHLHWLGNLVGYDLRLDHSWVSVAADHDSLVELAGRGLEAGRKLLVSEEVLVVGVHLYQVAPVDLEGIRVGRHLLPEAVQGPLT